MSRDADREHLIRTALPSAGGAGDLSALLVDLARAEPDPSRSWERVAFPGAVIGGRFELLRELGRGGFGVVFEARDRELGRLVAFKAVRPGSRASAAQRVEWLRREAEAAAQLSHENIVALHDAGRSEHGPYLVFELLDGQTLAERLQRGPLEPGEAVRVAAAVAGALAHAHAMGVLHRDLKPSNVFLTVRGQVKVLDFGLAHVFGWTGPVSGGTPAYMAPEQWRGAAEDARTDVFALGVMLYEMITGRLPFAVRDGRSSAVDPDGPAPRLEGLPPALRSVIASAISPEAGARPQNAEVLLERLVAAEGALTVRARPAWRRRAGRSTVVALAVAAAALGAFRVVTWSRTADSSAAAGAPQAPSSLDAYAHYFRAVAAADAGRMEEATLELERALEIDPEFALAHYFRAFIGEFSGVPMSTRRAQIEAALRFSERLPVKERLLVQAWGAHVRGDDVEAARVYRAAVRNFPEDAEVLNSAGDFLFHAGDLESAAGLMQRAMDARPGWAPPLVHLVEIFDGLGRLDQVLAPLRRAVSIAPNAATYSALGGAHLARGELEDAMRALRAAVAAGGGPGALQRLGDVLLRASRLEEAEAEGRRLISAEVPPRTKLEGYQLVINVRAFQGRYREALRLLDEMPAGLRATSPAVVQLLAVRLLTFSDSNPERLWLEARALGNQFAVFHLAYAGDLAHASELARGLSGSDRDLYEGLVAWRRGQPEAALGRLRAAARHGANTRPLASFFLAEVLSALGRDQEALDALRPARSALVLLQPRTSLIAARSLERLGRRDEARTQVDALLALWKSADPDLPGLDEARALRARLVAPEGRQRAARSAPAR